MKVSCILLVGCVIAGPVSATNIETVLAANNRAAGGAAWRHKVTLELQYAYSGQGLTGTSSSLQDLKRGAFVDAYNIPPNAGATGFDGHKAWEREPSGTITDQGGGDVIPLAITEAYQRRNLWWRRDRGGASIIDEGAKVAGNRPCDVLRVTPNGGKPLEAWFDKQNHLLFRTIEANGAQTLTTTYSDYTPVKGAMVPRRFVVDDGSGDLQTYTLTSAKFSAARPLRTYSKPAEQLHDFGIAGGARETTVPFRLLNNHIYANVSVNGSAPMTFILDTGGHSILTPDTAKRLGIVPQGRASSGGGGDSLVQSGEATVHSLRIGDATITNQPVTVLNFFVPGTEGIPVYGMIGYEFFARFITRFDYGKRTVTFVDKGAFKPRSAGTPVPIRLYHQYPEVLGSYDGVPGRFGIDTGSRMALLLNKAWAAKNKFPRPGTRTIQAQTGWGVGGPTYGLVFKGSTLKLGNVRIDNPLTIVSTDKGGSGAAEAFPSNVGGGVLKRFVVTFDYDHSLLYLKPIPGKIEDLDTFDRSGMWINAAPDGFLIVNVARGGAAEAAGLRKDDLITAIDGQPAARLELPQLREAWRNEPPGTPVRVTAKRAGQPIDLLLRLRQSI